MAQEIVWIRSCLRPGWGSCYAMLFARAWPKEIWVVVNGELMISGKISTIITTITNHWRSPVAGANPPFFSLSCCKYLTCLPHYQIPVMVCARVLIFPTTTNWQIAGVMQLWNLVVEKSTSSFWISYSQAWIKQIFSVA